MSTTTETGATPPTVAVEKDDPWRYGLRYVRRQRPDGTEYTEEVPLRQEDLLYPEESDFTVNNEAHHNDCAYLKAALGARAVGRERLLALTDHRVDWEVAGVRPLGPDIVVFDGLRQAWDPGRGTFPVRTFGARTLLVIEVTSPDSRIYDLGIKRDLYQRVGVAFYAVVDRPEARGGPDLRLIGYRTDPANPDRYTEVQPDERGRLWLETVRLWLAAEDGRAVLYDDQGKRIPDYAQLAREAMAAEARIKELEAEVQRLRSEPKGGPPNPAAP
jgi:colicin import membrane protein